MGTVLQTVLIDVVRVLTVGVIIVESDIWRFISLSFCTHVALFIHTRVSKMVEVLGVASA